MQNARTNFRFYPNINYKGELLQNKSTPKETLIKRLQSAMSAYIFPNHHKLFLIAKTIFLQNTEFSL